MAVGDTYVELGTTLKIAPGRPATEDQAGYGALSWTALAGPLTLPERGDTTEDVSEPTLADGRVEHFAGAKDGGTLTVPVKHIEGDAGQAIVAGGAGSNTVFSFQEVDPDGEAHFYFGRIMSYRRREASPNSFKANVMTVGVNSDRFTGTEES